MAYVDLQTRFTYGIQTVFGDFNKLANNDKFIKENGWQDGTVGVFFQASAPTGWTKLTTVDARALRVVSGAGGGVGGTQDPATTITLAHTHSVASDDSHTHLVDDHNAYLATSGSEHPNGASQIPIMARKAAGGGFSAKVLQLRIISGAVDEHTKKNQLPMQSTLTSGSDGSHNHGGVTNSQLSDISLAYVNVIFASKDTSTGYTDLSATFVHNTRHVFDYLDECAENDAFNYARRTPAGTVSLFASVTAPVGWTKVSSNDGALLRIVSGTGGGSGGTKDPSTVISLAHDHGNLSSDGAHTHTIAGHVHEMADANLIFAVGSAIIQSSGGQMREFQTTAGSTTNKVSYTAADGSGNTTSDGAHQHATGSSLSDITLAYFNVIQASKDSAGAPQVYTDMTTFFVDQDLLAYQDLQSMAYNDAYLYYHTMPAAAVSFFFQASAPLNWTKLATQNDMLLRIVSGTSGGTSGGSASISGGITLAHVHSIDSKSHTHTFDHTHTLDDGSSTLNRTNGLINNTRLFGDHGDEIFRGVTGGASGLSPLSETTETVTATMATDSHNHGAATGSSLSNVSLAYADVIQCSKN